MSTKNRLRKAYAAFKDRDYDAVEEACHAVILNDPQAYEPYVLLGKCAYAAEDFAKAEEFYVKATVLKPLMLGGWQGLLELFENSAESGKAVPPLKQIIAILEAPQEMGPSGDRRLLGYQLRLSEVFRRLDRRCEAEEVLKDVLLGLDIEDPERLKCLCLLADLQLVDYESEIQKRMTKAFESLSCSVNNKEECHNDALLNRVTSEYAEEALEADHELGGTLSEISAVSPPCGSYRKYHDFYLQVFCKAIYTAPASSTDRYNLRLQALEQCYKMIHGRSGKAKGLCTTPFPYVTALRLLEINEEIVRGSQAQAQGKLISQGLKSSKEKMMPNMFKSESSPSLQALTSPSSPASHGTPHKISPFAGRSIKIKLSGKVEPGHRASDPGMHRKPSLERRLSFDGHHMSFHLGIGTPSSMPGSPTMDMPPVSKATDAALPKFMRSTSLSCVRRLHRLDSGFLEKPKHIIGGNSPLVTEVSETIGRKLARILPWHTESKTQTVLAIRRREKLPQNEEMDRIDETPVTDLDEMDSTFVKVSDRVKGHIQILDSGISSGTRMVVPRMALVDLLLENKMYERALEVCNTTICHIETNAKQGGYPRTQAALTFKLQKAAALLRLDRLEEAQQQYKILADGVSEGQVSFGSLAGCQHVSVRQAAQKGLINVAIAQGDRNKALRLYEQIMGAGLMGKCPLEHWVAAEYGFMLYEDGDTVRAKQYLEKALDILHRLSNPSLQTVEADYHTKLAQVYWALGGKWKKESKFTYDHLSQAVAMEGPHQATAFGLLGKYYTEVEADSEKAKLHFEKALGLDPHQDAVGYALYETMKPQGVAAQKAILKKYRDGRATWVHRCLGDVFLEEGSNQMATQAYQRALKMQPENPALWERLGTAHLKMQRITSAQKSFVRALDLDGQRFYAWVQLGTCHVQMEKFEEGKAAYASACRLDPESPVAVTGLANCLYASCKAHEQAGSLGTAAKECTQALEQLHKSNLKHLYPKVFYKLLGDLEFQRHKQPSLDALLEMNKASKPEDLIRALESKERLESLKNAVSWYSRLVRLCPSRGEAWGDLAAAKQRLFQLTKPEDLSVKHLMERLVRRGLRFQPDSVHLWLALGSQAAELEVQEYAFCRALELDSNCTEAWIKLAKLYHKHDHPELAKQALTQARIRDPSSPSVWEAMGEMETDSKKALDCFVHALQVGSSSKSCLGLVELLNKEGFGFFDTKGILSNAVQRCVYEFPMRAVVWNAHGLCLEDRKNFQDAIFAYEMALALMKKAKARSSQSIDPVLTNLARVALKANSVELSIKSYEGLDDPDVTAHIGHACALFKSERADNALEILTELKACDLDGDLLFDLHRLLVEIEIHKKEFERAFKHLEELMPQTYDSLKAKQSQELLDMLLTLYSAGLLSEWHDSNAQRQMLCWIDDLASALGLTISVKAALHFCDYAQHVEKRQTTARDAVKRAVHLQPWNLNFQLSLLQTSFQQHGMKFGASWKSGFTCEEITTQGPWLEMGVLTGGDEAGCVVYVWIAVLSTLIHTDNKEIQRESYTKLVARVVRILHRYPQSIFAWFLLSVLYLKAPAIDTTELRSERIGKAIQAYRQHRDKIMIGDILESTKNALDFMDWYLKRVEGSQNV